MNLIGYIRVSRVAGREGDSFISPTVQRERCQAYADAHGHKIVGDWIEDLDQSGGRMDRPGLEEALGRIEAGEAQGLIVAKLDRFSRSLGGALATIERLQQAGAQLISVADNIDSGTPTGRLMRDFMLSIAQWYRETVAEGWDTSRSSAISRGVHIASHPPTGYKRAEHGGLIVDKKQAAGVCEAFQMRGRGETLHTIAGMLDKRKVRGEGMRGAQWTPQAVRGLLRNRAYLGEARSGEYVNLAAHEPIITPAEYEAAQSAPTVITNDKRELRLLSGLVRCAGCQYCLQADQTTDHGKRRRQYRCRARRHAAGPCPAPVATLADVVEPYVVERFLSAAENLTAHQVSDDDAVPAAEAVLRDAEVELAAYIDGVQVAVVGADHYRAGLDARSRRVDEARSMLGTAARGTGVAPPQHLREVWPLLSVTEQRQLLASAVDCVMLRGGTAAISERVRILWRGEGPSDLPSRGRKTPPKSYVWPDDPVPAVASA